MATLSGQDCSRIAQFENQGFLVVPGALNSAQIARFNREIDDLLERVPEDWVRLSESFFQAVDVLPLTAAFDEAIENPLTLNLLRGMIGDDVSFEEFSILIREPTTNLDEAKSWHRDITREYARRKEIDAISMVLYLTDVTSIDHCLSIIPETHLRRVDMKPGDHVPGEEVDLLGPAGTAIFFHARCIHAGKLKTGSRQRRSLHIYYSRASGPRTSEWTSIPARLHQNRDPSLPPLLYSKWNKAEIFEGTGKKPRDLDPGMTAPQMIREVQRRAKLEAAEQ